jgi:hypothetical protein
MRRDALAFVASFLVSVLLGVFNLRCSDDDCGCPPLQARPDPQGPLRTIGISFGDDSAGSIAFELQPERGGVSVGVDELIIEYQEGGVDHRVRYEVLPSM